jgi:hypothetical protein
MLLKKRSMFNVDCELPPSKNDRLGEKLKKQKIIKEKNNV